MSIADQVRAARNPQEAMLAIATALDELLAREPDPADGWGGSWQDPESAFVDAFKKEMDDVDRYNRAEQRRLASGHYGTEPRRVEITGPDDAPTVNLPTVSPERQARRRQFEEQNLKLGDSLGQPDQSPAYTAAYAIGGPMWLYLGNRELFMTYPDHIRQAMVADVEQDSPEDAHEMARDVLKQPCEMPDIAAGDRALAIGDA